MPLLADIIRGKTRQQWIAALEQAGVPCGPINDLREVFEDPQVQARGLQVELPHPSAGQVKLVASPMRLSATPPQYDMPPPLLGQHTEEVLGELLGYDAARIAALREKKVL